MILTDTVRQFWQRVLSDRVPIQGEEAVLICALSGGRDSVSLLLALHELQKEFGFALKALHVHHGIRKEADEDKAFCEGLCRKLGIPFEAVYVDAPALSEGEKLSLEDAARRLRYEALEKEAAKEKEKGAFPLVALAHHQTDQAETLLLHLLRGSGLQGLTGMEEVRPLTNGMGLLIRPLLNVPEEALDAYLQKRGITVDGFGEALHIEDATNMDLTYSRNRIRHELLPYLKENFNPRIVEGLNKTASLLKSEEDFLEEAMEEKLAEGGWIDDGPTFDLRGFEDLPLAMKRRRLRRWLENAGKLKDMEEGHIEALLDLAKGRSGRSVHLPHNLTVSKSYDILFYAFFAHEEGSERSFSEDFILETCSMEDVRKKYPDILPNLVDEKWMDLSRIQGNPVFRTRKEGDYILIRKKTEEGYVLGKQKLQDFFVNQKVPREERKHLVLLADGSHILWAVGYRMSDGVLLEETTKEVLHVYRKQQ